MVRFTTRHLLIATTLVALSLWLVIQSSVRLRRARHFQDLDSDFWRLQTSYDYRERPRLRDGIIADVDFHFANGNLNDDHLAAFGELLGGHRQGRLQVGWQVRSIYIYDSSVSSSGVETFTSAVPECSVRTYPEPADNNDMHRSRRSGRFDNGTSTAAAR